METCRINRPAKRVRISSPAHGNPIKLHARTSKTDGCLPYSVHKVCVMRRVSILEPRLLVCLHACRAAVNDTARTRSWHSHKRRIPRNVRGPPTVSMHYNSFARITERVRQCLDWICSVQSQDAQRILDDFLVFCWQVCSIIFIDPFKSIFKNRKNRNRFNRFKSI